MDSAPADPGDQSRVENMEPLDVFLCPGHGFCHVEDICIHKTAGACRKEDFPFWSVIFQRTAFHIEKLYRLVPVPGYGTPRILIQLRIGGDIGKGGFEIRQQFLPASCLKF